MVQRIDGELAYLDTDYSTVEDGDSGGGAYEVQVEPRRRSLGRRVQEAERKIVGVNKDHDEVELLASELGKKLVALAREKVIEVCDQTACR